VKYSLGWIVLCFLLLAGVARGQQDAKVAVVTNFKSGETVRYPVVILKGRINEYFKTLTIVNQSRMQGEREFHGLAYQGRFKALVELARGDNILLLQVGKEQTEFHLTSVVSG
jgi:hypothetical protein